MAKMVRRRFTVEEQAAAVAVVAASGRPIKHVAEEIGIDHRTLWQWVNNARLAEIDPGGALTAEQRNRIRDLEKQVAMLKRDLEFEKKAGAFFRELDRGDNGSL